LYRIERVPAPIDVEIGTDEGSRDGGADDVDDAGLGNVTIADVESVGRAFRREQRVLGVVVGFEEELAVVAAGGARVDDVRLPGSDSASHAWYIGRSRDWLRKKCIACCRQDYDEQTER
jgi:hypothetical protein